MTASDTRSIDVARVLLAIVFGLLAACWPIGAEHDRHGIGRIDLIAPRGRIDASPRAVRWSTTRDGDRIRVRVRDELGRVLFERLTDERRARFVRFTGEERASWDGGALRRIEIDIANDDGELIALSDAVASWHAEAPAAGD